MSMNDPDWNKDRVYEDYGSYNKNPEIWTIYKPGSHK